MNTRLPSMALILGIAGLIPFVILGILAQSTDNTGLSQRYVLALVGYGAVILAFLGGVHWGFVLSPAGLPEHMTAKERRDAARLGLGVTPSLIGFAALMTPLLGILEIGLAILIVGYIATVATESGLHRRGLIPSGYMALRWGLSIGVLLVLVTVLALRLIGARITF